MQMPQGLDAQHDTSCGTVVGALQGVTRDVPIVFVGTTDPVNRGLVASHLPVPLALWEPDRDEAGHVHAMIAMVEAEAVTAVPHLRDWLMSLAAFARRAADRHVGVVFVIS